MKEKKFYQNIQTVLENLPENFSILEEQVDIELQMKYFEEARRVRANDAVAESFEKRELLFDKEINPETKRHILLGLAGVDDVKAFRTIEKFVKTSKGELKKWGVLAMQESRMLIQSSLLDEQQVFISTGLGGKGQKIRYYVVFINKNPWEILSGTQQKLLKDEVILELKSHDGDFETIDFTEGFSTSLVMLPLQTDIRMLFRNIIDECNQYGDFLDDDMIVTNMKMLSRNEISEMLQKRGEDELDELEDIDFEEDEYDD